MFICYVLKTISVCGDCASGCSLMIWFHAPFSWSRVFLFVTLVTSPSSSESGGYVYMLFAKFEVGVNL